MIEQMKDVATGAIDALKTTPGLLALLIFNLAILGILGYVVHVERQQNGKLLEMVIEKCHDVTL